MKQNKPQARIIGANGNIFNLMGIASRAMKKAGLHEEADMMNQRIMRSSSYDEALGILTEYVEPIGIHQKENDHRPYDDWEMQ